MECPISDCLLVQNNGLRENRPHESQGSKFARLLQLTLSSVVESRHRGRPHLPESCRDLDASKYCVTFTEYRASKHRQRKLVLGSIVQDVVLHSTPERFALQNCKPPSFNKQAEAIINHMPQGTLSSSWQESSTGCIWP